MNQIIDILCFISGFCLGIALLFQGLQEQARLRQLDMDAYEGGPYKKKRIPKRSFLSRTLRILAPLNRRLPFKPYLDRLNSMLSLIKSPLSALEFFALKEIFLIVLPLCLYFIIPKISFLWLGLSSALGFYIPDLWLRDRIRKRKLAIISDLPNTIDLLSLCVSAGLDFMLAVRWVIEKSRPNPLIDELNMVLQETKMGKSRREALRDMSKRVDIPDVSSFVRTLIQADRIGTPVSETLEIISEDCRIRRFRRGERLALQAPMKMLIPLIFCILPTVAIIVAGPVFLQFAKTGVRF